VGAVTAGGLLVGVEPLDLGLTGVWGALVLLNLSRVATLSWRFQSAGGPVPPLRFVADGQHDVAALGRSNSEEGEVVLGGDGVCPSSHHHHHHRPPVQQRLLANNAVERRSSSRSSGASSSNR
jgi:hypothetical protein